MPLVGLSIAVPKDFNVIVCMRASVQLCPDHVVHDVRCLNQWWLDMHVQTQVLFVMRLHDGSLCTLHYIDVTTLTGVR